MTIRRRFTMLKVYLWDCPGCAFRNATVTRNRGRSLLTCRACSQAWRADLHGQRDVVVSEP